MTTGRIKKFPLKARFETIAWVFVHSSRDSWNTVQMETDFSAAKTRNSNSDFLGPRNYKATAMHHGKWERVFKAREIDVKITWVSNCRCPIWSSNRNKNAQKSRVAYVICRAWYTPNANMADHSVVARDELHESEVSQSLMFCFDNASPEKSFRPRSVLFYFAVPTSCCVSEWDKKG